MFTTIESKINRILTKRLKQKKYFDHYVKYIGTPTHPVIKLNFWLAKPSLDYNITPADVIQMGTRYGIAKANSIVSSKKSKSGSKTRYAS